MVKIFKNGSKLTIMVKIMCWYKVRSHYTRIANLIFEVIDFCFCVTIDGKIFKRCVKDTLEWFCSADSIFGTIFKHFDH